MRHIFTTILLSFLSGILGSYFFYLTTNNYVQSSDDKLNSDTQKLSSFINHHNEIPIRQKNNNKNNNSFILDEGFVEASAISTKSVVYIKNVSEKSYGRSYLDYFFNRTPESFQQMSSGSGVIFTQDGYIVSNNHVVKNATKLEIVYNKKTYEAELVGTDPSTDLAVLKIDFDNLPNIPLGSSKNLNVGEWVIAVGNPFNLTSTVTAGIVSAKEREINVLEGKFPIESFIQTDAAINPGNSGGALVNRKGELVGINTAILSKTGSYAGYGFAIPVDIVKKIVNDIIKYGEVQKAFIGGKVTDFDAEIARRLDISIDEKRINGVVLSYVQKDGSLKKAGLKEGDIILKFNEREVNTKSEFEEELSYHSPGEKITLTFKRNNIIKKSTITLTNREGTTSILKREIFESETLGAKFEAVSKVELDMLGINYGVKVFNIQNGLIKRIGIRENFIITDINRTAIKSPEKIIAIIENIRGRVIIEGINENGREGYYSFYLR